MASLTPHMAALIAAFAPLVAAQRRDNGCANGDCNGDETPFWVILVIGLVVVIGGGCCTAYYCAHKVCRPDDHHHTHAGPPQPGYAGQPQHYYPGGQQAHQAQGMYNWAKQGKRHF